MQEREGQSQSSSGLEKFTEQRNNKYQMWWRAAFQNTVAKYAFFTRTILDLTAGSLLSGKHQTLTPLLPLGRCLHVWLFACNYVEEAACKQDEYLRHSSLHFTDVITLPLV